MGQVLALHKAEVGGGHLLTTLNGSTKRFVLVLARVLKVFIKVEGDHKRFSPCKKVCVWGGGVGGWGGGAKE